jgi:drug/metabolite transporter (DMT)-like permease
MLQNHNNNNNNNFYQPHDTTTNNNNNNNLPTPMQSQSQPSPLSLTAVPGHLRRKRIKKMNSHQQQQQRTKRTRYHPYAIWIRIQSFVQQHLRSTRNNNSNNSNNRKGMDVSLIIAIALWYILGVFSIASSKILLTGNRQNTTTPNDSNNLMIQVLPLSLTLQQLIIGVSLLRFFLYVQYQNDNTSGMKPWPPSKIQHSDSHHRKNRPVEHLFQSALCFTFGFLATNYAFAGAAASFVETVKAAEPITSATVASWYGIETITTEQKFSLGTIIVGVLFSTMGGGSGNSTTKHGPTTTQTMIETIRACIIVMTANLCFSYRGLFQKLFRQHPSSQQYDDLNLQYRMQWYGVLVLSVPTFLFDIMPYFLREILLPKSVEQPTEHHFDEVMTSNVLFRYILLSLFNGISFTCYNLASTWILSRISVVHHAALNCIRRVFAVIVTSIFFGVPITLTGAIGIALAVIGFMSYTHYKVIQQQQQQEQQQQPQQAAIGTIAPGQSRTKQISYSLP